MFYVIDLPFIPPFVRPGRSVYRLIIIITVVCNDFFTTSYAYCRVFLIHRVQRNLNPRFLKSVHK